MDLYRAAAHQTCRLEGGVLVWADRGRTPCHAGYFSTKIFHPNVSKAGEICVNVLKKDWTEDMGLRHVLVVVRPFPLHHLYPLNYTPSPSLRIEHSHYTRHNHHHHHCHNYTRPAVFEIAVVRDLRAESFGTAQSYRQGEDIERRKRCDGLWRECWIFLHSSWLKCPLERILWGQPQLD